MASSEPLLNHSMTTVIQKSQVAPPPAALPASSLPLTFNDMYYILRPPLHYLFFYEVPSLTKTHFIQTIIPNLEHSLSVTLQHFFPFTGNLILFSTTSTRKPEIRYEEGDSVEVTFAECDLDFNDLTGYHPRKCDKFHQLIPFLGNHTITSDYVKIPVFSLQVTFFPNHGISVGMTFHHSLGDASTFFCFLKAWTSISRSGTDEFFLANGSMPCYDRLVKNPELDQVCLEPKEVETLFDQEYQPPKLPSPTDKVRATFVLTRTIIDQLKKRVSTQVPTSPYVSSFVTTCAYIWCCLAKARKKEWQLFSVGINCRTRLDPPIPESYVGNCTSASATLARTTLLTGDEGFITATKLIGDNLHKTLVDKDGIMKIKYPENCNLAELSQIIMTFISGTPKLNFYDMDFGWGKPKKLEKIGIDYGDAFSMDAGRESNQDIEIGVCLTPTQMETFVTAFNQGLEPYYIGSAKLSS